ncbi:MAG: hypothetical protein HY268_10330 [Deltaproteobacteria bacterium]|nr:hypothetical protein [Deltaproteobacteria bacterium]
MASRSPFGKESRVRILKQHLAEMGAISTEAAWKFIYRELLWFDGSTGLAHLYESDKAQPGRPWYDRTVVFTDMLRERFGNIPLEELKQQIDRLFRACLEKLLKGRGMILEENEIVEALTTLQPASKLTEEIVQAATDDSRDSETELYVPDTDLVAEFAALLVRRASMVQPQARVNALKVQR